uniref:Glutamate receptor n=1 Tax=Quercus lobata TaxID=97700 RepID=A0A7N2L2D2_QUELO
MSMALSDFYAVNHNYSTRLSLLTKDSGNDIIAAASAALDLIKNEEVQAIIPQRPAQARFVIELCPISQVPIISFSATSPFLSPSQNPFFIRTTQDESAQVKVIVGIVKAFGWREIAPIYEDTEYGNGLIPYLMDALQEIDTRVPYRSVIPPSSNNTEISEELNKLKANHTRIFLVHMTASLGSKLFVLAKKAEMMSEGYAWIITQGLSFLLDPMGSKVMDSLQVWALAMAVEKAGIVHSSFLKQNASNSNVDLAALDILEIGRKLHNTILTTKFQGLSVNFHLVKGQLEPSAFELFNVIGRTERIIGSWTGNRGFSLDLNDTSEEAYSTSKDKLKQPIWPGCTTDQPAKLRIGVPIRNGFEEFLKVEWHSSTDDKPSISGFVIDVFHAVQDALPFPLSHEFIPYVNKHRQSNGYDELLYQIKTQRYDAVVGDTTIVANRYLYVDFTLPYLESGVLMVVLVKDDDNKNLWIFLRPLSLNLWLTTSVAFIFTVQRLQPTFVDVKEIKRKGYLVGYQKGSFIKGLLMKQLDFDESKFKPFETPEEYHEALSKGILNGGVAAVFGEIPYIKLFLAKYCSRYTMVGPTYKTDGFGFAFQQGSPLVPYISRAILNVTQDQEKIAPIERKYFSSQTNCEDQSTTISSHSPSLGVDSFGGLFLIAGITSMVSLLVYVIKFFFSHWPALSDKNITTSFWSKLVEIAKLFDQKDLSSHHFKREESRA